jgi:type I restriction enzyme S subunit
MFTDLKPYPETGPIGWNHLRLKTVARNLNDRAAERSGLSLTLDNVEGWTGRVLRRETAFDGDGKAFSPGDVLFGKLRPYLAKVAAPSESGRCVGEFLVLRPDGKLAATAFLAALLRADPFIQRVVSLTYGAQMPRAEWNVLGGIRVGVPPLAEQAAIVKYLAHAHRRIDHAIAAKRTMIALLEEQRQAIISQAVTRGLDPTAPLRESGIPWLGRVPAHWDVPSLRRVSTVFSGSTPSRLEPRYWSPAEVPWLASGAVSQVRVQRPTELVSRVVLDERVAPLAPAGSVVVGLVGQGRTRGKAALLEIDACINQNLAAIVPSGIVTSGYLFAAITVGYMELRSMGRGGNQLALNGDLVKAFSIPLPPFDEQSVIVECIEAEATVTDAAIDQARREIGLLREFRTRLTADVVTGQVDVRHIAATLPELDPDDIVADVIATEDDLVDEADEFLEDVDA